MPRDVNCQYCEQNSLKGIYKCKHQDDNVGKSILFGLFGKACIDVDGKFCSAKKEYIMPPPPPAPPRKRK